MANLVVLSPTDSDDAAISASSAVSDFPATNAQGLQPKKVWRTTGAASEWLSLTFAAPVAVNAISIVWPRVPSGGPSADATVRVRGKVSGDPTASPLFDTTALSAWPAAGKPGERYWPNYLTYLSWPNDVPISSLRIDLADPSNAAGYLDVGRVKAGRFWQPGTNFDLGGQPLGFDVRDVQNTTPYGFTFTDQRAKSPARKFALQISSANKNDILPGIAEIQRLRGQWGDVTCILDPDESTDFHRYAMQGLFQINTTPLVYPIVANFDPDGKRWGAALSLLEVL